jgi:hypothetical protein
MANIPILGNTNTYGTAPNYKNASVFDLLDFSNPYNPLNLTPQPPPPDTVPFINQLTTIADRVVGVLNGTAIAPDPVVQPWSAYKILQDKSRILRESVTQRPLLRLWDKDMNFIAPLANEQSATLEEVTTDSGQAQIVIRRDDWFTSYLLNNIQPDEDLNVTMDPIPTQTNWRTRWGGKVSALDFKRTTDGIHLIELQATSNREHLKHVLLRANPLFPPEVQIPKMWFLPGNTRTINTYTLLINLARLFAPWLAIPTNIFNPGAWMGANITGVIDGFNPLDWPLQVAFVNPFLDQSRFSFINARWADCDTVTKDINKDAGCIWRAYTWLKEDRDSPHTELTDLSGSVAQILGNFLGINVQDVTHDLVQNAIRPTRNCVVFACENKSGIGGPTGTALDGVFNLAATTADDSITEFIYDLDQNAYVTNPTTGDLVNNQPSFAAWVGEIPAPPSVVFRDVEYSGVLEAERVMHKLNARTVSIGGKSPAWLNQLITFGIRWALSQIKLVITAGQFGQAGGPPLGEGIEEIYQGQLDDVFLAYQSFTDPLRVLRGGALGYQEVFEQAGGTAYTTSGILTIRQGLWKTRAYQTYKASIQNGVPWLYGRDFMLGDRLGFEIANIIHADNLHSVKYEWSREKPVTLTLALGDDTLEQDPTARAMRVAQNVWNMVGMALGSQDMF